MGQGLLFTPLTRQVKNFTKHTKQNPRGAVSKGAVQTGRKEVWVAQGHAQWVQCAKIMSSSGANLLFPQLPAFFCPLAISIPAKSLPREAAKQRECFLKRKVPPRSCLHPGTWPVFQYRTIPGSFTHQEIPYKSIDQLKHHPGLTSIPAQSYLLHSLKGWFPREISKVIAHWKPY